MAGDSITFVTAQTRLGVVLVATTQRGICSVQFGANALALKENLAAEFPGERLVKARPAKRDRLAVYVKAVMQALEGQRSMRKVPLDLRGTALQLAVWKYLQTIPAGRRVSYSEVARDVGRPLTIRAVASACAANRIALLIPCHRVVRSNGELAGYRWGLARKRALLTLEAN